MFQALRGWQFCVVILLYILLAGININIPTYVSQNFC